MLSDDRAWVVVLAGGVGSRFWPVSTPERPKQLLPLAGPEPLIADTVARARDLVPEDRLRILAGPHLLAPFRAALPDLPEACYWIEPRARGTAPVLAWAAHRIREADPEAVMISLHADHLVRPRDAFAETLERGVSAARREELLVCVGVEPEHPETGYGYVAPGDPISGVVDAYRVAAFHEKPDAETARDYVGRGYLWNSGIFVWKAATLVSEVERVAPEIGRCLVDARGETEAYFEAVPEGVIDRAVMERSDRVGTVRASFEWDDLGSWEAMSRTREPDGDGNVVVGEVRLVDAGDNIVYADSGSIVLHGVRDLIVVQAAGTTVVLPRERGPHMKELLKALEESE